MGPENQAGGTTFISDKVDVKPKFVKRGKKITSY
jgi:hypothetical protein